jgi:hypothetical protein
MARAELIPRVLPISSEPESLRFFQRKRRTKVSENETLCAQDGEPARRELREKRTRKRVDSDECRATETLRRIKCGHLFIGCPLPM